MGNTQKCEVGWCQDEAIEPAGLCVDHIRDLKPGDPRLGPELYFFYQNPRPGGMIPGSGKFFFLTTDKNGRDHVSEVSKSFYTSQVSIDSAAKVG